MSAFVWCTGYGIWLQSKKLHEIVITCQLLPTVWLEKVKLTWILINIKGRFHFIETIPNIKIFYNEHFNIKSCFYCACCEAKVSTRIQKCKFDWKKFRLTCFVDGRIFGPSIAEKNESSQKWNRAFAWLFANETKQLE